MKVLSLLIFFFCRIGAYTFDTYANKVEFNGDKNPKVSLTIGTKDIDLTNFKLYLKVKSSSAQALCAIIVFCAADAVNWAGGDILAIDLYAIGNPVEVSNFYAANSTKQEIASIASPQAWTQKQKHTDPSAIYSMNDVEWKLEVVRKYKYSGTKCEVGFPSKYSTVKTPVAINIYPDGCPSTQFSYGSTPSLASIFIQNLRPSTSLIMHLAWKLIILTSYISISVN